MDIRLRHVFHSGDKTLYFYNGEASIRGGVVTIPHDRIEWAQRAWMLGYRLDAETGEELALDTVESRNVATAEAEAESAESAQENDADEGADAVRQPADDDRVRESPKPRRRSVRKSGARGRKRNGAAGG